MKNKIKVKKYKMKTHSGAKKRFKFTATGLIKHAKMNRRHLMYGKSRIHCAQLRKKSYISVNYQTKFRRIMPYA